MLQQQACKHKQTRISSQMSDRHTGPTYNHRLSSRPGRAGPGRAGALTHLYCTRHLDT